jgi:hypothetical protein
MRGERHGRSAGQAASCELRCSWRSIQS